MLLDYILVYYAMTRLKCCCMGFLLCHPCMLAFQQGRFSATVHRHEAAAWPWFFCWWSIFAAAIVLCLQYTPANMNVDTRMLWQQQSFVYSVLLPTYVPTYVPTHACSSATSETDTIPVHLCIECLQGATCMLQLDMSTSQPRFTLMLQADPVLTACSYVGLYHVILLFLQNIHLHHHGQVGGRTLGYLKLSAVLRPCEPLYNLFAGKWFGFF